MIELQDPKIYLQALTSPATVQIDFLRVLSWRKKKLRNKGRERPS